MSRDYWVECIECALNEVSIAATAEQIASIAGEVEVSAENYGMAHGHDIASANLRADRQREVDDLKRQLRDEVAKVTCRECNGTGAIRVQGPVHGSTSQCWKCGGAGRHK